MTDAQKKILELEFIEEIAGMLRGQAIEQQLELKDVVQEFFNHFHALPQLTDNVITRAVETRPAPPHKIAPPRNPWRRKQ